MSVDIAPWTSSLPTYSNTFVMPLPESSSRWPPRLSLKPSSGTAMPRPPRCRPASTTATFLPSLASSAAALSPAAPAPMTATSTLVMGHGQRAQGARGQRGQPVELGLGLGEAQAGQTGEDALQRHPHLHAGELGADAGVDAAPEGHVQVRAAGDVDAVGVRELLRVAVRRGGDEQDALALLDPAPA